MKAAQITAYGGQDVIQIKDVADPVPLMGEIVVEVHAAGVNPFDYTVRDGKYQEYIPLNLPATLGSDVAGTVAQLGEGVSGFQVGQEVFGMANAVSGQGSFAQFTPVPAGQFVPKPKSVDFVTAGALPLAGVSAYQALVDHMGLQAGKKILIHGGAGGIGSLAIQIAKDIGAYVATTASPEDADYVKSLGADEVIDYKTQDFAQVIEGYDAVFDTIGGETNAKSYTVLQPGGFLVSMVQGPDEALVKQYEVNYVQQSSQPTPQRLTAISELVDSGKLRVNVDKTFPLEQAAEALEYLKTGHPRGKVVIQVQ